MTANITSKARNEGSAKKKVISKMFLPIQIYNYTKTINLLTSCISTSLDVQKINEAVFLKQPRLFNVNQ
jgi:hypothetical protein